MKVNRGMPVAAVLLCSLSVSAQPIWTATTTSGAPSARALHTAVWTGSRMMVWGGHNGGPGNLNDGGRYDPVANTWAAITTTGSPSARQGHTAVWTGSRMIVWGGEGTGGFLNSGGQYDPVANTWTAMTTTGAPSARQGHTAVWTGSRMIVWGGEASTGYVNSGGQYDPVTNTWTAMTTTGAPSARLIHTAVWTGSRMIVWGGGNSSGGQLDDGGQYDPAANTWRATTTTGAPSARGLHEAVWTGSKMIVWGGTNGSAYSNDGGQYDPVANTWTATATSGAPSSRRFPTAVWTGSRMIVWGGWSGVSVIFSNDGGQYDPVTDTWTAMTTAGAPSARGYHTAVWTGSRMIAWGGMGSAGYLNDGGQWTAASDPGSDCTPDSRTVCSWILPSSAHASGLNGAFFTTDLTISNTSTADGTFAVKFLGHDADGRSGPEIVYQLGAGKTTVLNDVLGSAFGVTSGYGAIQIRSSPPATLAIVSETSTHAPACVGGTFGQSVTAVPYPSLIAGGSSRTIPGIRENSSFRTNLILSNGSESATDVSVVLVLSDGSTAGTKSYHLEPLGMHQVTQVVRDLGVTSGVSGAQLVLTPASGVIAAYASAIDNLTNDPRTLLPQ